jgi:hypothetical protein
MENLVENKEYKWSEKWFNHWRFPLIPVLQTRPANKNNTSWFSLDWLIVRTWSLDSFSFEFAFVMCTHWGIGFTILLPYLRLIICLPLPEKFNYWFDKKTSRSRFLNNDF